MSSQDIGKLRFAFIYCLLLLGSKLIHLLAKERFGTLVLPLTWNYSFLELHSLAARVKELQQDCTLEDILFSYNITQTHQTSHHFLVCLWFLLILWSLFAVLHGQAQISPSLNDPTLNLLRCQYISLTPSFQLPPKIWLDIQSCIDPSIILSHCHRPPHVQRVEHRSSKGNAYM